MFAEFGEDRLSELRRDVRERLAPSCAGWPRPLFDRLIDSISSITYKYERLLGDFSLERSDPTGTSAGSSAFPSPPLSSAH